MAAFSLVVVSTVTVFAGDVDAAAAALLAEENREVDEDGGRVAVWVLNGAADTAAVWKPKVVLLGAARSNRNDDVENLIQFVSKGTVSCWKTNSAMLYS